MNTYEVKDRAGAIHTVQAAKTNWVNDDIQLFDANNDHIVTFLQPVYVWRLNRKVL